MFLVEFRIYHFLRCEMKIEAVHTNHQKALFLDLARTLYAKDPEWVCPLDNDINEIFNPNKNVGFKHGNAMRWLLLNEDGQVIGRIAAFYSEFHQRNNNQKTGGIGFFECIELQAAAFLLFDTAKQ